jgi:hypothetical protein
MPPSSTGERVIEESADGTSMEIAKKTSSLYEEAAEEGDDSDEEDSEDENRGTDKTMPENEKADTHSTQEPPQMDVKVMSGEGSYEVDVILECKIENLESAAVAERICKWMKKQEILSTQLVSKKKKKGDSKHLSGPPVYVVDTAISLKSNTNVSEDNAKKEHFKINSEMFETKMSKVSEDEGEYLFKEAKRQLRSIKAELEKSKEADLMKIGNSIGKVREEQINALNEATGRSDNFVFEL